MLDQLHGVEGRSQQLEAEVAASQGDFSATPLLTTLWADFQHYVFGHTVSQKCRVDVSSSLAGETDVNQKT